MPATMIPTVEGFPIPVDTSGPQRGPTVVLLGAADLATAAYDGVCARLHTANLRTVVLGADARLSAKSVLGVLDVVGVRWAVLVGDRAGADLAWELAASRLDRFTSLIVIDRGHPRVPDKSGNVRDPDCPPVEVNTTALVSSSSARAIARASQRFVYGDFRMVDMLTRRSAHEATAQLAAEIVLRSSTW